MALSFFLSSLCAAALAQSWEMPVKLVEGAGVSRSPAPVRAGLPFAQGELSDAVAMELRGGGAPLPVESWVLSRWPDGSVRWLGVEFLAPPVGARGAWEGRLAPRSGAAFSGAELSVEPSGAAGGGARAGNGTLSVADSTSGVFELSGPGWSGTLRAELDAVCRDGDYQVQRVQADPARIEHHNDFAITLRKEQHLLDGEGREVFRFVTRATLFRGYPGVKLHHTLEVVRGVHQMKNWQLLLPAPAGPMRLGVDQGEESFGGDFHLQQADYRTVLRDGREANGRLMGLAAGSDFQLAVADFWQLHPKGLRRGGGSLAVELCPELRGRMEALEHGFGRSHTLWLRFPGGAEAGAAGSAQELAALARHPLLPHTTPERYCRTLALGPIALPASWTADSDRYLEQSAQYALSLWESKPNWHYGLQHYGDFFDREHTFAYYGHINQEYDIGLVMLQHFARTGKVDYLENGLILARHYADVDISDYGGVYQHRATANHLNAWVAKIFARAYEKQARGSPRYDGTVESVLELVAKEERPLANKVRELMKPYVERGVSGAELERTVYRIIGELELTKMVERAFSKGAAAGDEAPIRAFVQRLAQDKRARSLGLQDADRAFQEFFDIYGGSFENFPSFHVDISANHMERHAGGHALIESVVLAHWLTAEPYFREVALLLADDHTRFLVPRELAEMKAAYQARRGMLWTRSLGWPLINLCAVWQMTEGVPEEAELHGRIADVAGQLTGMLTAIESFERIQGSIHAGVVMEALVNYHLITGDKKVASYLKVFAPWWASHRYDPRRHAFQYHSGDDEGSAAGYSGLCLIGLVYSEHLQHDEGLKRVLDDAWEHLARVQKYPKAFTMIYRNVPKALYYLDKIRGR